MINPDIIRANPDKVKQNTTERNGNPDLVDQWLKADHERAKVLQQSEDVNRRKNELSAQGKSGNIDALREQGRQLKEEQTKLEQQQQEVQQKWEDLIMQIPNLHFDDVPRGRNDKENKVLRQVGEKPDFNFTPLNHAEIGEKLGLFDFESGAKVAGSQFYYLLNDAVRLEYALAQFGLNFLASKGFNLVITPDMAKSRFYLGTGYAPKGDEAQTYEIKDEDLGLIATAEVTMAAMHADEILPAEKLPLKYAAISHCFRKEAGAYGKYSKGLYRVHQFTKLEMFVYCTPEQSEQIHQELLAIEEEMMQKLGIAYQVLEMCTGDLGNMAARKYDVEAWMPGRGEYGEVTSTSNCTDYQARNLNIRYRNSDGQNQPLHMLNGTAIAFSRVPIAILENYQQADGTVKVPEALQPFMGTDVIKLRA